MIKIILCLHTVHSIKKIKLDYYRGKDCMNNFCLDLREHATKMSHMQKKDLVLIMIIKRIIKSDIIVTTQENKEELLMIFVI